MLQSKHPLPLVFDGAFGTYYAERTHDHAPCELANISAPETVRSIHREYIAAGAQAIKTNTFACNAVTFPDRQERIRLIRAGYENALAAAEEKHTAVFADIGPIADGESSDYMEIAQEFLVLGAEHFLFETQAELAPLIPVFASIRTSVPTATIIVSFAAAQDGFTRRGRNGLQLLREAAALDTVDAVGLNCICGPAHLVRLAKEVMPLAKPFSAMPNSGYPSAAGGRTVYINNAEYFAGKLAELKELGAAIIGGCCGTTPEHIRTYVNSQHLPLPNAPVPTATTQTNTQPIRPNAFREKLKAGTKKVIAVELDPPQENDLSPLFSAAKTFKELGVDLLTFADSPLARTRADSLTTAAAIGSRTGIEVMPHLTCRDRNQIALKGGLLAANALGVSNVLAVTGDPLIDAGHGKARSVFSMNSQGLMHLIGDLNASVFRTAPIFIGGALNINALHFDVELARAQKKIDAGADFFLTQPVFTDEAVVNLAKARQTLPAKILAGIFPVAGYKNALFLNNEVSGITIDEEFLTVLAAAKPEDVPALSVEYSLAMARKAAPWCDGFYLMTPLRRFDIVALLAERIRTELC